jgi:O-antigen ligase
MILAITAVYWSLNKTKPKVKIALLVLSGLLFVPLSLGASRGSFIALLLVVLFFLAFHKGIKKRVSLFAVVVIASGLFSVLLEYLGRGLISRVLGIQAAIETHSSSAIRLVMWSDGWQQFLSSPIFGSSLQLETFQFHPHNIFIEILLSTGVVGLILFLGFLFFVSISAVRIVRKKPESSWVVVIFLVGFANNMFSSAIWAASTLALGAALVIAVDRSPVSISLAPR